MSQATGNPLLGFVHRRRRGAELFLLVLALAVGIGMSGRGAVELIIASIALEAGLFDQPDPIVANLFSALVIMAVVTTPMPRGFVKINRSPSCAPEFLQKLPGFTSPVTDNP